MRAIFLLLSIALSATVYCQTESKNDSIRKPGGKTELQQTPQTGETDRDENLNAEKTDYSASYETNDWDKQKNDSLIKKFNLFIPPYYVGPGDNPNRIPTSFPFENNYAYYANWNVGLGNRGWVSTASESYTYPSLGATTSIKAMLTYRLTDKLTIAGGPFASKNMMNGIMFNDFGYGGIMSYNITNRFKINAFGQYSARAKHNFIGNNASGMFNQSYYGGTFEYKINDTWGVQAGMKRELDPFTGKWTNTPIFGPVFYGK